MNGPVSHPAGRRTPPAPAIAGFALVQSGRHTAAQRRVLELFQCEQRALDAAKFTQADSETVLPRIRAELAQDKGSRHCALLDRCGQADHVFEFPFDQFSADRTADQRRQCWPVPRLAGHIQVLVRQIGDARRKLESKEVA